MNESYTLFELNQALKTTLSERFAQPLWVRCEISELKHQHYGHYYLTLIEKAPHSSEIIAKQQATIWKSNTHIVEEFNQVMDQPLSSGMNVLVLVKLVYHVQFGLSLNILRLDPNYTQGALAIKRRETIEQLKTEGVFDLNKMYTMPLLPGRIALISSPQAAGYEDFIKQLSSSKLPYRLSVTLFPAIMQGNNTEPTILAQLDEIMEQLDQFDVVVIVRGGGAVADLAAFDSYNLAYNLAQFPLPIISGIGHEKDQSVVDLIAHTTVKTPTAAAEFILNCFNQAMLTVNSLSDRLKLASLSTLNQEKTKLNTIKIQLPSKASKRLEQEKNRLNQYKMRLKGQATTKLRLEAQQLQNMRSQLTTLAHTTIQREHQKLEHWRSILQVSNPKRLLERGFIITELNHKPISSIQKAKIGDTLTTIFKDGQLESCLTKIQKSKE